MKIFQHHERKAQNRSGNLAINTESRDRSGRFSLLVLTTLILSLMFSTTSVMSKSAKKAKLIEVHCHNDINFDRSDIQSAIDDAGKDDTVKIYGTCQFDGVSLKINKSNLTLAGHKEGNNWSTVLKGTEGVDGLPQLNEFMPPYEIVNVAIEFGDDSSNAQIENVSIRDLKFSTFNWTINVYPQISRSNTYACELQGVGNGYANNVSIENNWFDNIYRAALVYGATDRFAFKDNIVSDYIQLALVVQKFIGCTLPDTTTSNFEAGRSTRMNVSANTIISAGPNAVSGILLQESSNSQFSKNDIDAVIFGIILDPGSPSTAELKNIIANNHITNTLIGILFDGEVSGFSVMNNQFSGSVFTDIYLCGLVDPFCAGVTTNVKVLTTNHSNTVVDLGEDNTLIGTQNLANNPNVSQEVKDNLSDAQKGRPQH